MYLITFQVVIDFFGSEGIRLVDEKLPSDSRFRYWHMILEHPKYNCLSYSIMVVSMIMTASFTIMVVLESIPSLLDPSCSTALSAANESTINSTGGHNITHGSSFTFFSSACTGELIFFVVESVRRQPLKISLFAEFSVFKLCLNPQYQSIFHAAAYSCIVQKFLTACVCRFLKLYYILNSTLLVLSLCLIVASNNQSAASYP